jgi:signal transduction histidine kinase
VANDRLRTVPAAGDEATSELLPLLGALRHEIGNHLNSLKVALTVLNANLDRFGADKVHDYLGRSLAEIAGMEALFRSFRTLTTFGRVDLEDMDLAAFLRDFSRGAAGDLERRGIAFATVPPPEPVAVHTDPRALRELLFALLSNAHEALAGRDSPRITLAVCTRAGEPTITLSDNGCGVPAEDLERVFRPFVTSKPKRAGLGLAIVERVAALIGARVRLESSVGVGTEVIVTLPAAVATPRRAASEDPS